jgi:transcriptional regulator with XRE-family HTH domain
MSLMNDGLSAWVIDQAHQRNWSLRKVAREAKISQTTVADIANGQRLRVEAETVSRLAHAFGAPVEDALRLAGILPAKPVATAPIRQRRIVYEVNGLDRLTELWRGLSVEDQGRMLDLMERLQAPIEPRIIGAEDGDAK